MPPLLLLDDVLSELDPARRRVLADARRRHGPDTRHRDAARRRCRVEPAQLVRGGAWIGSADGVARRSCRASARRPRSAGSSRLAGSGRRADRAERVAGAHRARRHAARAHELVGVGVRARAARADDPRAAAATLARAEGSASRPDRCRNRRRRPTDAPRRAAPRTVRGRRAQAAELAAAIEDEKLRKLVATSGRGEPRQSRDPTARSDTLTAARKAGFAGLFLYG